MRALRKPSLHAVLLVLAALALAAGLALTGAAALSAPSSPRPPLVAAMSPAIGLGVAPDVVLAAATSAEKAGQELGNIVFAWAGTIVFAIAALMVAVAIGRRNVGELVTIVLITGAGSLFVLNKAAGAQTLFESIIKQIT